MTQITFACDRCSATVTGDYGDHFTAGFYDVSQREFNPWAQFGLPGENLLCDDCVQSMPEYQALYGAR